MSRPLGSKNKSTEELEKIAKRLKVDPFMILLLFAKGDYKTLGIEKEKLTSEQRLKAASECCQYLHVKRRVYQVEDEEGKGFNVNLKDFTRSEI